MREVFEDEDKTLVEAQQNVLGDEDLFDMRPSLLPIDLASARARRIYKKLIINEQ